MELWDVYDVNRNYMGKVIDRHSDEKLNGGEYHLVVEAIIINSKAEILLNKRSKFKNKYPSMWEGTGGACIKGENSLQAILRELKEELGLDFNEKDANFYRTLRDDHAKDFKDIWVFRKDVDIKDLSFTDGEVEESKWVTIDEFEKMIKRKEIIPTIDFTKEDYKKCLECSI